ncbi:glycoside hydrolase family 15 protein [Ceratobasidium sp. AG-Ba]|nr:glycoside hydrolase family 15 protein [Ceratobasidium sp. AG-Ba]
MSEKLATTIPIYVAAPQASPKSATRKHGLHAFVAGALIGAAALWSVSNGPSPFASLSYKHTPAPTPADDLRDWISNQADFGHRKIFERLMTKRVGAAEGLVIAAPSTNHPDYFYTWTRAIVTGTIMDRLLSGENELEAALRLYAYSQGGLQKTCNPSGCPTNGGLGEPKFHADGSPYTGSWGRPQRDGPALRAITLTRFANYLLDRGRPADSAFVSKFLYQQDTNSGNSVIKNDLEYTSHHCFKESFDLWEEMKDHHFFTLLACRKALDVGSKLALRLHDPAAADWYGKQSRALSSFLLDSRFRFPNGAYRAYLSNPYNRRGIDNSIILGVLAAGDKGDPDFGPTAPAVLASVKVYVDAFRGLYAIANEPGQREGTDPIPTGRYPEDKWDGYETTEHTMGNPWYICTIAVSHLVDLAVSEFLSVGRIEVTDVSLPFFKQFADVKVGTLTSGSEDYNAVLDGMRKWSDGFYNIVRQFQGPGGVLYEQFGRITGLPQGAPNLTWSFAAFANAARARHSLVEFMP